MKELIVKPTISIREAMKILDRTASKCLLVIDDNNKLIGTLTDGDLRRSILAGANFSSDISDTFYKNPTTLKYNNFDVNKAEQLMREKKIDFIPLVNEQSQVVDYVTWSRLGNKINPKKINAPVVIMAGGKGTRMEPFTKVLPKPLVPIQEKPIIEHIIERFNNVGCNKFYISVNYKARILKAYFDELEPNYQVSFVEENKPLGTAGCLQFLTDEFDEPFLVTNCDIIINADYIKFYEFHKNGGYDISLVASAKEYIVPYGACELNLDGHLSRIHEKPSYELLVNTGLYVLSPEVLRFIPENKIYHITDLIDAAIENGKKIGVYPIDDDAWVDVGQWSEYKKAIDNL